MGGHLGRRWFKWTRQLFFWPVKFLIRLYNRCAMNEQCLIEAQLLAPKQVSLFSMGLVWYAWMPWFTVFYLSVSLLVISMLYTWHRLLDQRVQIHIWEVGETWVEWLIVWNMDAFQFGDVATTDKISLENGHVGLVREGGGGVRGRAPVQSLVYILIGNDHDWKDQIGNSKPAPITRLNWSLTSWNNPESASLNKTTTHGLANL